MFFFEKGGKHDVEHYSLLFGELAILNQKINSLKLGNDSSLDMTVHRASDSSYNALNCDAYGIHGHHSQECPALLPFNVGGNCQQLMLLSQNP